MSYLAIYKDQEEGRYSHAHHVTTEAMLEGADKTIEKLESQLAAQKKDMVVTYRNLNDANIALSSAKRRLREVNRIALNMTAMLEPELTALFAQAAQEAS